MRFFFPALVASFAAVAAGAAIDASKWDIVDLSNASEVIINEHCRGMVKWSKEGLFRSGSTVRYHGHLWQCSHWSRGEEPESSDTWRDLGECDPDVQQQVVLAKRSTSNIQSLSDDDDDTVCLGFVEWEGGAMYRSGTTVKHGGQLWQTNKWTTKTKPGVDGPWSIVATCSNSKPKMAKRACEGFRNYDENALVRSGTTVKFGDAAYQAKHWVQGVSPLNVKEWTRVGDC